LLFVFSDHSLMDD